MQSPVAQAAQSLNPAPSSGELADRESLINRVLPSMKLSDGSTSSITAPSTSKAATPEQRAASRFAVHGNAVVTGGCGGLGLEAARNLLEHGCSGVALLDLDLVAAKSETDRLAGDFPEARVTTKQVDVTDYSAVYTVFVEVCQELGSIDHLLCFAGVSTSATSIDVPIDQFRKTIDINTTASFICAQLAARHMIEQERGGSIVFVASASGHVVLYPQPLVAYAVSKAAVIHAARSLAAEWAVHGIRVNSISPGYTDTIMTQGDGLERHRKIWAEHIPMGRLGIPGEMAGSVVLLSSQAGNYITGVDILVDGGLSVF